MKNKTLALIILALISCMSAAGQKPVPADDPSGNWKFEAPSAPEGFALGSMDISLAENLYKVSLSFTGSDYKLDGDRAVLEDGSFMFVIYLQGQEIAVILKKTGPDKMEGLAIHPDGEVPLTLVRNPEKK